MPSTLLLFHPTYDPAHTAPPSTRRARAWTALAGVAAALAVVAADPGMLRAQAGPGPTRELAPRPFASHAAPLTMAPFQRGDMVFTTDAAGALYARNGLDGTAHVLLPAGSYSSVAPSPDGRYVAYALPAGGPDPAGFDVHIRTVETGRDLPDVLHNAMISRKPWTHNERGFFYTRIDPSDRRQRVYYHGLGKDQGRDAVTLSRTDHPEWHYDASVSDDGQFAIFTIEHPTDTNTRLYFIDLDNPGKPNVNAPVVHLVDEFTARYSFIDNAGASYFFLRSDRGAPRGNVILAKTDVTRSKDWPVVIPESADTLVYARTAGDQFILPVYRSAGREIARVYGPPDPAQLRAEFQRRLDSLRKERTDAEREGRRNRGVEDAIRMRAPSPIRLELDRDLPAPAGASVVAVNSVADREEIFYTLRMPDGSTRSFVYNVKNHRAQPFPSGQPTS